MLYSGQRTAIVSEKESISYNQLVQHIRLFSELTQNLNGHAIICSENSKGWVFAFYSLWKNGLVPVPVDCLSSKKDIEYIIADCQPSVIFCSANRKAVIQEAIYDLDVRPTLFVIDEYEQADASSYPTTLEFYPDPEKTAVIIYTSGTTGNPKGVMLSFRNLKANIDAVCTDIRIFNVEDKVLLLLPLHHIFPLLGTMVMPLLAGSSIVISPSMASGDIVRTLKENQVTLMIGVPKLYTTIHKGIFDQINKSFLAKNLFRLAKMVGSLQFSRLIFGTVHRKFGGHINYLVCGGAALELKVGKDLRTLGFDLLEGYGMTEAAPMISFNRPGNVHAGTAGQHLSCVNVEVREGELVVKGENVMQGYYGKPDDTAAILKDGWLYTGDQGYIDDEGFIHITGRKKEIIILSNGKNINPSDIEEQLELANPVVKEVGVFQDGDRLHVIVVPNKTKATEMGITDLEKYIKWDVLKVYNQSAVSYKMVTGFTLSNDELPRTRLGKIQRFKLAEMASSVKDKSSDTVQFNTPEFLLLKTYIFQEKKIELKPTDHIEFDLGLDSLDKVSLQVYIDSTFGVKLDLPAIIRFDNMMQLCEYIAKHKTHEVAEKIDWSAIIRQRIHLKLPQTWITSHLFVNISRVFFSFYFRMKGRGVKNIPDGPCIIVPNHQSFFDGLFVASYLRFWQMRKTFFYAKEKHVRNPFVKFIANRNNIIVMDLNNNLKESIQKMAEVLKEKKNLIIFPEGTRTRDGRLGDFKKTFAILSRELNVPVVPVTIKGAFEALPKGSWFPKPFRKIRVEFLSPVFPENHTYDALSEIVRNRIKRRLES
jgi:long-chain acyl-CoA synthetase